MDEHYYLYALIRAGCQMDPLGQGVDPRFLVEIVTCGQTAGVASRVGLDQFDVSKLERGNTDFDWLSRVAIRHNQVICDAACRRPLLPLRMGTLFQSRGSLLARMQHWEAEVVDFLDSLGDCQEWAAKIYIDKHLAEENLAASSAGSSPKATDVGAGTLYPARKREHLKKMSASHRCHQKEIAAIETSLIGQADRYYRSCPLPANLSGRPEKMLWNAAFLVERLDSERWLALVEKLRGTAGSSGLALDVSGPWPPYHFCPALETSS